MPHFVKMNLFLFLLETCGCCCKVSTLKKVGVGSDGGKTGHLQWPTFFHQAALPTSTASGSVMNPKFGDDAQLTEISLLDRFLGDSANRFFSEKRSLNGRMLEQQNVQKIN